MISFGGILIVILAILTAIAIFAGIAIASSAKKATRGSGRTTGSPLRGTIDDYWLHQRQLDGVQTYDQSEDTSSYQPDAGYGSGEAVGADLGHSVMDFGSSDSGSTYDSGSSDSGGGGDSGGGSGD